VIDGNGSNITVNYKAGTNGANYIDMNAGFEVKVGLEFHAYMDGCNN